MLSYSVCICVSIGRGLSTLASPLRVCEEGWFYRLHEEMCTQGGGTIYTGSNAGEGPGTKTPRSSVTWFPDLPTTVCSFKSGAPLNTVV